MLNTFDFDDQEEIQQVGSPLKNRPNYAQRYTSNLTKNILSAPEDCQDYVKYNSSELGSTNQKWNAAMVDIQDEQLDEPVKIQRKINNNILQIHESDDELEQSSAQYALGNRKKRWTKQKQQNSDFIFHAQQVQIERKHRFEPLETSEAYTQVQEIVKAQKYFQMINKQAMKKQLYDTVQPMHVLKMNLIRDNGFFKSFWPQFKLCFGQNCQGVAFAKRTTARPVSTFILSAQHDDFQEDSPNYLGKMKSNALGDILNVFGPGLNPSNAKEKGVPPRQLLATIVFDSTLFGNSGNPRSFKVYAKQEQYDYYKDFDGDDDQQGYNQKYRNSKYANKLIVFQNRKPAWNKEKGAFFLNFAGRVKQASVKNFILDDPFGSQAVMFGKLQENLFAMNVSQKISPYLSFAIALAAFDTKLIFE